jgi:hypothetical protein
MRGLLPLLTPSQVTGMLLLLLLAAALRGHALQHAEQLRLQHRGWLLRRLLAPAHKTHGTLCLCVVYLRVCSSVFCFV